MKDFDSPKIRLKEVNGDAFFRVSVFLKLPFQHNFETRKIQRYGKEEYRL